MTLRGRVFQSFGAVTAKELSKIDLAYVDACFESGGIRQRVPRRTCLNESMAMSLGLRPLRIFHTCMIMYLSRRLCRDISN